MTDCTYCMSRPAAHLHVHTRFGDADLCDECHRRYLPRRKRRARRSPIPAKLAKSSAQLSKPSHQTLFSFMSNGIGDSKLSPTSKFEQRIL